MWVLVAGLSQACALLHGVLASSTAQGRLGKANSLC